jgi:hypothetical protein
MLESKLDWRDQSISIALGPSARRTMTSPESTQRYTQVHSHFSPCPKMQSWGFDALWLRQHLYETFLEGIDIAAHLTRCTRVN